jgi:hypothetical protein
MRSWRDGNAVSIQRKKGECSSERESGALAVAPSGDRGRQRKGRGIRFSQPKGAEGQAANQRAKRNACCIPRTRTEATRLKTALTAVGIGRANGATQPRKPSRSDDAAPRRKRRAEARAG